MTLGSFCPQFVGSLVIVVLFLSLSGCAGVHLYDAGNAEKAKKAVETYEKVNVQSIVETGRKNVAALAKAELEIEREIANIRVQRHLVSIIGNEPKTGEIPLGWPKLENEVREELNKYSVCLDDDGTRWKPGSEESKTKIRNIVNNRRYVAGWDVEIEKIKKETPLPAEITCENRGQAQIKPKNITNSRWGIMISRLTSPCRSRDELKEIVKSTEALLSVDGDYREVAEEMSGIEKEIGDAKEKTEKLMEEYNKAKKNYEEAVKEAQKDGGKNTEKVNKALGELQGYITKAEDLLKGLKDFHVIESGAKIDFLDSLLSTIDFLQGEADNRVSKQLKEFLDKNFSDIVKKFEGVKLPPVNVLLLELAYQRLKYRQLSINQYALQARLSLLRERRDLYEKRAETWVLAADNVIEGNKPLGTVLKSRELYSEVISKLRKAVNLPRKPAIDL